MPELENSKYALFNTTDILYNHRRCSKCSPSASTHDSQSFAPVIDSLVYDVPWHGGPDLQKAFSQLINISYWLLIHTILHPAPDLIIHRTKVWALSRPHGWFNGIWRCSLKLLADCCKKWTFKFDQELEQYSMSYPFMVTTLPFRQFFQLCLCKKVIQICSQLLMLCVKKKGWRFY